MKVTLFFTRHAKERMAEKAISKEQIIRAIQMGSKFAQTGGFLAIYRDIAIAYKVIGKNAYKIKTVMVK